MDLWLGLCPHQCCCRKPLDDADPAKHRPDAVAAGMTLGGGSLYIGLPLAVLIVWLPRLRSRAIPDVALSMPVARFPNSLATFPTPPVITRCQPPVWRFPSSNWRANWNRNSTRRRRLSATPK
jgi:hypothetical protein